MKRISSLLILVMVISIFYAIPFGVAEEIKPYSEALMETPEGSDVIAIKDEPSGSILALAKADDNTFHLLRWKELVGSPELIPITVQDVDFSAIDVAPDGIIALSTVRDAKAPGAEGAASMEVVVVWLDASGKELSRTIFNDTPMIRKALSGRRLACASWSNELVIYDSDANVLLRESMMNIQGLLADEKVLYCFVPGMVYLWSLDAYQKVESKSVTPQHFGPMTLSEDGTIYYVSNGLNRLDLVDGSMYLIMDQMGTCLANLDATVSGFIALENNTFVFHGKNILGVPSKAHLPENNFVAVYREMEEVQNRTPFVINDVFGGTTIRKAASAFQKLHPELKVTLRTYQNLEAGVETSRDDTIRIINTELLAGGGGDVLLLDYLPMQAIISRGMLLDISHVAESAQLLEGIAKSIHHSDGKVYAIPAEFSVFFLHGNKTALEPIKALPDLLDAPIEQGQMHLPMSASMPFFFAACKQDFIDENGDILFESVAFTDFLNFLHRAYSEIEGEAEGIPDDKRIELDRDSLKNGAIAFYPNEQGLVSGLSTYYYAYGEEASGYMRLPSLYGPSHAYRPKLMLAIPKSARDPSLSEAFIQLVLSDEMGWSSPLIAGFSTVEKKLDGIFEDQIEMINGVDGRKMYMMEDGVVKIRQAPDEAYYRTMLDVLKDVSVPYDEDDTIFTFIKEEMLASVGKDFNAAEAANAIKQRAFLYLNE